MGIPVQLTDPSQSQLKIDVRIAGTSPILPANTGRKMAEHRIRLLATDFDGTIFRYGNESHLYTAFSERISAMRADGAKWMVCSGRTLHNLRSASRRLLSLNIKPDYILVRHWLVMSEFLGIWLPDIVLTANIFSRRREEALRLSRMVANIVRELHEALHRCRIVYVERFHIRVQCRSDEDMDTALRIVEEYRVLSKFVTVGHGGVELDVRYIPYAKATAVAALAHRYSIPPDEILTVGDGRSDLGMMTAGIAAMIGCPSNGRRDTIQFVSERGGHIARRESLGGTIDVINAYLNDDVCSDPPEGWQAPADGLGIPENATPKATRHGEKSLEIIILIGTAIVGILALAKFGIIPCGHLIVKPVFYVINKFFNLFM
jgi:hydroxymethylpyrimidine pyrophosphatase-like HAD family hydrolase